MSKKHKRPPAPPLKVLPEKEEEFQRDFDQLIAEALTKAGSDAATMPQMERVIFARTVIPETFGGGWDAVRAELARRLGVDDVVGALAREVLARALKAGSPS